MSLWRAEFVHRWAGRVLALALALALAWYFSGLLWRVFGPELAAPAVAVEAAPAALAQRAGLRHVFGEAPKKSAVAERANVTLSGVISGHPGVAVLVVDGALVTAVEGDEFLPGWRLQKVGPAQVDILRGGAVETVELVKRVVK